MGYMLELPKVVLRFLRLSPRVTQTVHLPFHRGSNWRGLGLLDRTPEPPRAIQRFLWSSSHVTQTVHLPFHGKSAQGGLGILGPMLGLPKVVRRFPRPSPHGTPAVHRRLIDNLPGFFLHRISESGGY